MVSSGRFLDSDCSNREVGMDTLPAKMIYGLLAWGDCGAERLDKLPGFELVVGGR